MMLFFFWSGHSSVVFASFGRVAQFRFNHFNDSGVTEISANGRAFKGSLTRSLLSATQGPRTDELVCSIGLTPPSDFNVPSQSAL